MLVGIVVLIQSLTSLWCILLSFLKVDCCHFVCLCVLSQGQDALWMARNSPWGGKDKIGEAGARELEVRGTALPLHDGV